MRVLVITHNYGDQYRSGSDVFCCALIDRLKVEHQLTIVAKSEGEHPNRSEEGMKLVFVPERIAEDEEMLARLVSDQITVSDYDVVYNLGGLFFGGAVVSVLELDAGKGRVPLVNHFQIVLGHYAWQEGYSAEEQKKYWRVQEQIVNLAEVNIFPSVAEARIAEKRWELDASIVSIIPNGIELEGNVMVQGERPANSGEEGGERIVFFAAGRLSDYMKGADLLYRAFAELYRERQDVFLQIVSDADCFETMLNDIPKSAFGRSSWLAYPDLVETMRAADVVVVPSRYEPFGMIAIEAMMLGKPVVAGFAGGLQEIVVHEQTGLLVEPESGSFGLYECLSRLAKNRKERLQFGKNGKQRVRCEYGIERVVNSVCRDLKRAVLKGRSLVEQAKSFW